MGPEGAISIIYRKELAEAADPKTRSQELLAEYRQLFANPYLAAERGFIDEVIEPAETRTKLIAGLELLKDKRQSLPPKKHGNLLL